jgi:transcriptional regulator with XRE-family HTH domain
MELTFGGRLRQQRERQDVSLTAIAAETKIKVSLLEALERDDLSHWPQRIYRRAYVRAYARAIGLDPETVVREFIELYPDPVETLSADAVPGADAGGGTAQGSTTMFRRLVTSAFGAVPAFLKSSTDRDEPANLGTHQTPQAAVERAVNPHGSRAEVDADTSAGTLAGTVADTVADGAANRASESPIGISASSATDSATDTDGARADRPRYYPETDEGARQTGSAPEMTLFDQSNPDSVSGVPQDARTSYEPRPGEIDLAALADLCTRLGRVLERRELVPLLRDAAQVLGAVGLTVWAWDAQARLLRASVAHGYEDVVLTQWPGVPADADNGLASAFRSASTCVIDAGASMTGAIVVPLLGPRECAGVLAVEVRRGGEQRDTTRACAAILAAQLVTLIGPAPLADAVNL